MTLNEQFNLCLANGLTRTAALLVACRIHLLVDRNVMLALLDFGFNRYVDFFKN